VRMAAKVVGVHNGVKGAEGVPVINTWTALVGAEGITCCAKFVTFSLEGNPFPFPPR
jgi:hypothetical protein